MINVRKYDDLSGRFISVDPLWSKYIGWTPYHYCENDPVNAEDGNGKDRVLFNSNAEEMSRIVSSNIRETYVLNGLFPVQVQMPNEISGQPEYNRLDYQIAASVAVFNNQLHTAPSNIPAPDGHSYENFSNISIDVNEIKAITGVESKYGTDSKSGFGTGAVDPMQVNNPGSDKADKDKIGLTSSIKMNPQKSLHFGLEWFMYKSIGWKSAKTGIYRSMKERARKYNGGGDKNYSNKVLTNYNNLINK